MRTFFRALVKGIFGCILLLAAAIAICCFGGLADVADFGFEMSSSPVEVPSVTVVGPKKEIDSEQEATGEPKEMEAAQEAEEPQEAEESEPESSEKEEIRLLFAGDLYLTELLQEKYRRNGIQAAASEELLGLLHEADLFVLNQEFPFGTTGEAMEEKEYTFRVPPDLVSVPLELGVDLVTLANNHILDFGRGPLSETIQALDGAGIAHVGAGEDLEAAKACRTFEVQGKTIGFLGASRVVPESSWSASKYNSGVFTTYDATKLIAQIQEAKQSCDFVAVLVHWGIERNEQPEDYQKDLARRYIDAGADAVIGSHPHVLQGIEYYQGKPIFYSLGNFVFSNRDYESIVVELTLKGDETQVRVIPCISKSNQMNLLTDTGSYYQKLQELSFGVRVDTDGIVSGQ